MNRFFATCHLGFLLAVWGDAAVPSGQDFGRFAFKTFSEKSLFRSCIRPERAEFLHTFSILWLFLGWKCDCQNLISKKVVPPVNPSCFQVICHYLALEYLFPNQLELKTVKDAGWCETWGWFDTDLFAACLWSLPHCPHKKWQPFAPYHCGPRVLTCVIYWNVHWDVWV